MVIEQGVAAGTEAMKKRSRTWTKESLAATAEFLAKMAPFAVAGVLVNDGSHIYKSNERDWLHRGLKDRRGVPVLIGRLAAASDDALRVERRFFCAPTHADCKACGELSFFIVRSPAELAQLFVREASERIEAWRQECRELLSCGSDAAFVFDRKLHRIRDGMCVAVFLVPLGAGEVIG